MCVCDCILPITLYLAQLQDKSTQTAVSLSLVIKEIPAPHLTSVIKCSSCLHQSYDFITLFVPPSTKLIRKNYILLYQPLFLQVKNRVAVLQYDLTKDITIFLISQMPFS